MNPILILILFIAVIGTIAGCDGAGNDPKCLEKQNETKQEAGIVLVSYPVKKTVV